MAAAGEAAATTAATAGEAAATTVAAVATTAAAVATTATAEAATTAAAGASDAIGAGAAPERKAATEAWIKAEKAVKKAKHAVSKATAKEKEGQEALRAAKNQLTRGAVHGSRTKLNALSGLRMKVSTAQRLLRAKQEMLRKATVAYTMAQKDAEKAKGALAVAKTGR